MIDHQTESLLDFCTDNLRRICWEGFDLNPESDFFPHFGYFGQISQGEEYSDFDHYVAILNENAMLVGLVIEFKQCAAIEIEMVLDQIFSIAGNVIDFSIILHRSQISSIVNPQYSEKEQEH